MPEQLRTLFQEGHPYHAGIHLDVDSVMVYGLNDTLLERIAAWREHGFHTSLMIGLAWGPYRDYLDGHWDGVNHREREVQMTRDGKPLLHGASLEVAYLVPTNPFQMYLIERLLPVIDNGIEDIFFEEPEFWVDSGYSPAFKEAWEKRYKTPWQGQHTGAEAQWKTSSLKSDLYLELFEGIARTLKEYAARQGRTLRCYIATHSLINYAQWRLVSPEAAYLNSAYCDGFIAQVWTGTSRTLNVLRGERASRTFLTAFLEYGYFVPLQAVGPRTVWALHDPIEDNPGYTWSEYRYDYLRTVVASLLRPEISRFEICPWPNRIFNRSYAGQMIPDDYNRVLRILFDAFRRMGSYQGQWLLPSASEAMPEVGLLMDDSSLFQRPPSTSAVKYDGTRNDGEFAEENRRVVSWNEFFGLPLPLLEKGIVVTPVSLQAVVLQPELLQQYRVLVVSYQFMKPATASQHQILANWVKQGGKLLYVGDGQDDFQHIPAWWNKDGAATTMPLDDLVTQVTGKAQDKTHQDSSHAAGKGELTIWAINPAAIAEDSAIADQWATKVLSALALTNDPEPIWLTRRGPYIAGMNLAQEAAPRTLPGQYIDLFQGNLPVYQNPTLETDQPLLWYDLAFAANDPVSIIATSVPLRLQQTDGPIQFHIDAPAGTPGVARIKLPTAPSSLLVREQETEQPVDWEWHEPSQTVYCSFTWNSDQARLIIE